MNQLINDFKSTEEYQDIINYFMEDVTTEEQASEGTMMFEIPFKREYEIDTKNSEKGFFIIYQTGHLRFYDATCNRVSDIAHKKLQNKTKQYTYLFNILIDAFKRVAGREPDFLAEMEELNSIEENKYPLYVGKTWKYDIFKKEFIDRLSGKKPK